MVDPSAFGTFNLGEIMERGQRMRMNDARIQEYRSEQDRKKRLGDLLPGAAKGDQGSIDELYRVDPEIAIRMDDRQRKQAKEELDDLTAAVRWADNPEKWQYVQQHFGQKGIDLSPYGYGDRERGLLALGQLGKYLESAPKSEYRSIEAGGSLIDVSGGNPRVVIAPNTGEFETGAPVRQANQGVPQGAIEMLKSNPSLAPQFDEKYGPGAAHRVLGGQSQSGSGGFPY